MKIFTLPYNGKHLKTVFEYSNIPQNEGIAYINICGVWFCTKSKFNIDSLVDSRLYEVNFYDDYTIMIYRVEHYTYKEQQ